MYRSKTDRLMEVTNDKASVSSSGILKSVRAQLKSCRRAKVKDHSFEPICSHSCSHVCLLSWRDTVCTQTTEGIIYALGRQQWLNGFRIDLKGSRILQLSFSFVGGACPLDTSTSPLYADTLTCAHVIPR